MHEISIAQAILELAQSHVPAGSVLRKVHVLAGPMRAIDPLAMDLAWRALTDDADPPQLALDLHPWTVECVQCGRRRTSDTLESTCSCGCRRSFPVGGEELQLTSIEVDDAMKGVSPCASQSLRTCSS